MTPSSFLIYSSITLVILFFIRIFWKELTIVGAVVYGIGYLTFASFISALVWAAFVTQSAKGWGWTFAYFFVAYTGFVIVYVLILLDIIGIIGRAISGIFKSIFR